MNIKNIKYAIKELQPEEKVIGITSLLILLACFFPWYDGPEFIGKELKYLSYNGFQSYAFIIGYMNFIFAGIIFGYIISRVLKKRIPGFTFSDESIMTVCALEIIVLSIVALFIYTSQTFNYSQASVRFGLYVILISSAICAVFSYLLNKRKKFEFSKQKAQQIFETNFKDVMKPEHEEPGEEGPVIAKNSESRNIVHEAVRQVNRGNGQPNTGRSKILEKYYQRKRLASYENDVQKIEVQEEKEVLNDNNVSIHLNKDRVEM